MKAESNNKKNKRPKKRIVLWTISILFVLIVTAGFIVYNNLNRIVSNALTKSFNSNIMSDVYELKFDGLSINLFQGNIQVHNVELKPREKPLGNYPYINSTFHIKTHKMLLENVQIFTLMKTNELNLDKIEIIEPEVDLKINGDNYIFLPFADTTGDAAKNQTKNRKSLKLFLLKEFALVNANFHVTNSAKEREFNIQKLNISLEDLLIDPRPGKLVLSNKNLELSVGEFTGSLQKRAIKHISFRDYKTTIDSLNLQQTPDTSIFHYADFNVGLQNLDIQTADSIYHLTMKSFDLSRKNKSIELNELSFKPNVSDAAIQREFAYQKSHFSGTIGKLSMQGINFDSLIHGRGLFVDDVALDKVSIAIFKDHTKPIDRNRIPDYLGQQIASIKMPLMIKRVKATNANLVNTERKKDGGIAKAHINRITANAKNISNRSSNQHLTINAVAYIENKAPVNLSLAFSYLQPQYSFNGTISSFNLTDLNTLLNYYTPAAIKKGRIDEIRFSGTVYRTGSSGTMKFLYHDLEVDLELHDKAKWKSSVLSFAANTYLNASNPVSAEWPAREVQFKAERDMNKGFVNILIKSVLSGLKETMISSKENTKAYKAEKKAAKKEIREAKRQARKERKKN